ncbi:manganese efflux pump, partial [Peribacillus sp. NPDC056705]|uniref:manganese efflux pump n=1 Tax=Peribacillus sp. NPDC056705 TaxID=3345918 RepID=UPI0037487C3E
IIPSVLLAMAISLDGFGAGVTYGLRKTKIPALSVLIISFCSGLVLCISMMAGSLLQRYLSPDVASIIGAAILIVLGGWSLYQQLIRKPDSDVASGNASREEQINGSGELVMETAAAEQVNDPAARNELSLIPKAVFSLEIPKMGVVIQILRSPSKADLDDSG